MSDHAYLPRDPHDTQIEAADIVRPHSATQRQRVADYIRSADGATDTEIQAALDLKPNSERPRRRELVQEGTIEDSGVRRPALDTGNKSIVWIIATNPVTPLEEDEHMSQSLSLDELPNGDADRTRRDQYGRYKVVPPNSDGKPVGYTRVTTIAKILDDGGGLISWKASMVATGMMLRPGLRAQWEALVSEAEGDPWYRSLDFKARCKSLVEECAKAGGSADRAEIGTSLHTITAMIDAGRAAKHLSPETERDLTAYVNGLIRAGCSVVEGAIELTVVLDHFHVAGTLDRLMNVPGFDLPLIADLKTGADLSYSWQSIAVQLAAYSRADAIYIQGIAADGSEDQRLPMPEVDQEHGLIMWLNAGTGELELWLVDLASGWDAFILSLDVRDWRKNEALAVPLGEPVDSLVPALEASLAALAPAPVAELNKAGKPRGKSKAKGRALDADAPVVETTAEEIVVYPTEEIRAWLAERIRVIGAHAEARKTLGLAWPEDLPFLHRFDGHTVEQLDAIEALCDRTEALHELAFGPGKPGDVSTGTARLLHLFPGSTEVSP